MNKNNFAKFSFYYMLSLVTLFIISISTGVIIFEIIDKIFLDPVLENFNSGITGAFSGILIATPIFYFINNKIYTGLKNGEIDLGSEIRKWFSYFILFVSSVVVIAHLISVLNNFLEGGLTLNFVLKALTVLIISGLIFTFYFLDIKRKNLNDKLIKIYFFISLILISSVFITALFFMDSPEMARNKKLDQNVLQDFDQIKFEIDNYFYENESLPENLNEVENLFKLRQTEMQREYVYNVVDDENYELCSTFNYSNLNDFSSYYDGEWKHEAGYQCIQKKVVNRPKW